MQATSPILRLAVAVLAAAAAGCSGHHDAPAPAEQDGGGVPPASASASSDGMMRYVADIAAASSDTARPDDLAQFVPPADAADPALPLATANDAPVMP